MAKASEKTPAQKAAPKDVNTKADKTKSVVAKPKSGNKPNALQQPLQPSEELAAIIGSGAMARGDVVSKVWQYIKTNHLQDPKDGREIIADEKLQQVFGKQKVTMFEMNKLLSQHLK